jgi:hypothetical protein
MSQNKYITNTFNKGLYLDAITQSQPDGTYQYALNSVTTDFNQVGEFGNENSNRKSFTFDGEIIGWGYIDEKDRLLVFTRNGLNLVNLNDETVEFIANDDEFNCNWNLDSCEWIIPQFKTIDPCKETIVYWSSGCEYFKVNIDEMLDDTRKSSLIESMKTVKNQCSDISCEYFKVFKLSCQPRLTPVAYNKGGGGLLSGAYQFSVRLLNNEGAETNWFTISDPVYIGGDHNEAGEITNGVVEITMTNLDCNFDYGELAVITTIGGKKTAKLLTRFNYTNGKYSYTYSGEEGISIAIDEIITRGKTYLQGRHLIQYNGNMLYWGIRQVKNLNYQKKVIDNVKTNWIRYRIPFPIAKKYNIKSYMRGESYHFGVKYNSSDGRSTRVFHIPPTAAGNNDGNSATGKPLTPAPIGTIGITQQGEYKRDRTPRPDTVRNPEFAQQDIDTRSTLDAITTNLSHACTGLEDCEDCAIAATQCDTDSPQVNELVGTTAGLIGVGVDASNDLEVDYTLATFKEGADHIMSGVENRERQEYIPREIEVNKGIIARIDDGDNSGSISDSQTYAGQYFDVNGDVQIELTFKRTNLGRTIISEEEDILYPDHKDCSGEYIYGDLANEKVRKHQVPWTSVVSHYVSNSVGVPSKATPDADEFNDAYVDIIGVQFTDVPIPTEEELGFKLCENNPYTIVQVLRTSKNRTIHSKGIITNTLLSENDGKDYLYPTHGVNSEDSIVNRYIKVRNSRKDPNAQHTENYNFWSLDTMTKAHALNITHARVEGIASGIGYRHGLYEYGEKPADSKYGSQIDQRGTRQAINLNKFDQEENVAEISYKIYAPANEVISPPTGAPCALMNKYQQESVWFGAELGTLKDRSFKGDVLEHDVPISDAQAYYVALVRDLPNQYGDLSNMPYFPILEAGNHNQNSIEGMCGDIFIGPHSFVRTSYVSDKVGDLFPISNMVPGKADRCVCDSPEDAVHSVIGAWNPTELPKDGDAADPKNWAGLHTDTVSHNWTTANTRLPFSDYYYPKVVKTLITYWGEFEVNPYMRQRGDLLNEQVYNNIKPVFGLDSSIDSNSGVGWDDDYLNQFYWEVEQPSRWKITQKTLIRSLLVLIAPALGITTLFTADTALEFITNLGATGAVTAIWMEMLKVLFNNKKLEELFQIGECKMDSEGGEKDNYINNFFQNFSKYNKDFTIQNNIEVFYGLPAPYYTCDCSDCSKKTTNEVYISDEQKQNSQIDAYGVVRPKNFLNVRASYGDLIDIFIENGGLYAHTTDQWIPLQYARTLIPTNTSDIILGQGPLLGGGMGPAEGTVEGFGGLLSRQHAINTQYGRIFLDYKARRLFLFSGGKIKELSDISVYSHFRNKLPYCGAATDCDNQHLEGLDIALGLDPRLERILITKRDSIQDSSWTMSYSLKFQNWVSFHSYIPRFYVWDRARMITSDGTNFWSHDVKDKYQTYMGKYYPHVVRFRINDRDILHEQFKGAMLDTYAIINSSGLSLNGRRVTFNKIWVHNDYQSSGYLDLYPITTINGEKENIDNRISENPHVNLTHENGHWRYNSIVDLVQDYNSPLYIESPCGTDIVPINTQPYSDSTAFSNNIHLNNYLTITFILDNFDDHKLYTRSHTLHNKKNPEFYQ